MGISRIESQLACPNPPARLVSETPPPIFADDMAWPEWADALMGWGAGEARRRRDLARWFRRHCQAAKLETAQPA